MGFEQRPGGQVAALHDQESRDRGAGLVSVLVVLVVLGSLAGLAFMALPDGPPVGPSLDASAGAASTPAQPRSLPDSATEAACTASVRAIEQAATAKLAADGRFPGSVEELVIGGWLSAAPVLPGYQLLIEAATGKVLVNGLPAGQGCAAGYRPDP
jgi:hypothetical protein